MTKTRLLLAAALLGAAASPPALAQGALSTTQSPPNVGASENSAQPANSMPGGTATGTFQRPGSDVATTQTGPTGTPQAGTEARGSTAR